MAKVEPIQVPFSLDHAEGKDCPPIKGTITIRDRKIEIQFEGRGEYSLAIESMGYPRALIYDIVLGNKEYDEEPLIVDL